MLDGIPLSGVGHDAKVGGVTDGIGMDQHLALIAEDILIAVTGVANTHDAVGITLEPGRGIEIGVVDDQAARIQEDGTVTRLIAHIGDRDHNPMRHARVEVQQTRGEQDREAVVTEFVQELAPTVRVVVPEQRRIHSRSARGIIRSAAVNRVDRHRFVDSHDRHDRPVVGDVHAVDENGQDVAERADAFVVLFRSEHEIQHHIVHVRIGIRQ